MSFSRQPSKASTAACSASRLSHAAASFSASAMSATASSPRRPCWLAAEGAVLATGFGAALAAGAAAIDVVSAATLSFACSSNGASARVAGCASGRLAVSFATSGRAFAAARSAIASTGAAANVSKTPHSCCQATASAQRAGSKGSELSASGMNQGRLRVVGVARTDFLAMVRTRALCELGRDCIHAQAFSAPLGSVRRKRDRPGADLSG